MSKQNHDTKNLDPTLNRVKSHDNVAKRKINGTNKIIQPTISQTEIQVFFFLITVILTYVRYIIAIFHHR